VPERFTSAVDRHDNNNDISFPRRTETRPRRRVHRRIVVRPATNVGAPETYKICICARVCYGPSREISEEL